MSRGKLPVFATLAALLLSVSLVPAQQYHRSGSTPGGSDTQIQFNNVGVFGGDADLTWNATTNIFTVNGSSIDDDSTAVIVRLMDGASERIRFRSGLNTSSYFNTGGSLGVGTQAPASGSSLHVNQATLGTAVLVNSSVATNDDPTETIVQGRAATTDATVTTINTIAVAASTTARVECNVIARRTGGASGTAEDGASYTVVVAVKGNAGTNASEIAAETVTTEAESQAGFNVTAAPSAGNELIQVTGAAGNNITWHSTCRVTSVGT